MFFLAGKIHLIAQFHRTEWKTFWVIPGDRKALCGFEELPCVQ